jgi:predicted Zn-dependent protease
VRVWYHLRAARSSLLSYHNQKAVRHLQVCLRLAPEDPEVLRLAARAARRARSYEEAERLLEQYQRLRGLDEAGSLEQLLLAAERAVDQVADVCHRHVKNGHPETPLILEALARGYLRQYRLAEARLCLDRWLHDQPDNPEALCLEGQLHLDYEHAQAAALKSYRRAVELDPDHEDARLGLAVTLLETKAYAEAAEHLGYVRRRQPENLRVQVGLAECRDGLGEADEAVRLVDEVLARQPDYGPALALRGRLALGAGQMAEAETWLRQAVARDPANHPARYNLLVCLHQNGKDAEAEEHRRWLKQREDDLKRFNEIVTHDMKERPHDPALHCTLGRLLLRSGYQEEGLRWLHSALRQDPQYAPARQALDEYYRKAAARQRAAE